jgi:peroxiredoxin
MSQLISERCSVWPKRVLQLAGISELIWGLGVMAFPNVLTQWVDLHPPSRPQLWQALGLFVVVSGLAYLWAASAPARRWPITLAGLVSKLPAPLVFAWGLFDGSAAWHWGWIVLAQDVVWWVPFAALLYDAFRQNSQPAGSKPEYRSLDEALREARSHRGATLAELSARQRVLVIFLRHAGCTFCREALADLSVRREQLESHGVVLALVHMGSPLHMAQQCAYYELEDVHRFRDPECRLYRAFGLERGRFRQLFGWRVWRRVLRAALVDGHGLGALAGDGFQMPGVFLLEDGQVINAYRAQTVADRPDYAAVALCPEHEDPSRETPPSAASARRLASVA